MTGRSKKVILKSLSEELEIIKEQLNEIHSLKQKGIQLEATIVTLQRNNKKNEDDPSNTIGKCKFCDTNFIFKEHLKKHVKIDHIDLNDIIKKVLTCGECDEKFDLNWKLEKHLRTHAASTVYECKECNKTFYLEWRLKQHMKAHACFTFKFCHYFNSL